jgi:hypothetical protein
MFPLIETAAAFAAVMLVASLFVSALVQAIHSALRLRAAGLCDMLLTLIHNYAELHGIGLDEEGERAFVEAIITHPLLHSRRTRRAPSAGVDRPIEYLDQDDLIDLVRTELQQDGTRRSRDVRKAVVDIEQFTRFVERWYETVGATASQYFKHRMRQITLVVSCALVLAFNFDGLRLLGDLHRDDAQRSVMARQITMIQATSLRIAAARAAAGEPAAPASSQATLQELNQELDETSRLLKDTGVSLGWPSSFIVQRWRAYHGLGDAKEPRPTGAQLLGDALLWLAGLLFSCVMLSLGAPFWATTLGSLVNLTNAVQKVKSGPDGDAQKGREKSTSRDDPAASERTPRGP